MKPLSVVLLSTTMFVLGCDVGSSQPAHNFETPEGAVLTLEDAYRTFNVDAAAECRAFRYESELMYDRMKMRKKRSAGKGSNGKGADVKEPKDPDTKEKKENSKEPEAEPAKVENASDPRTMRTMDRGQLISQFTGIREFQFRAHIQQKGIPNLFGVTTTFTDKKVGEDGVVILTIDHKYPDGSTKTEQIHVVKTDQGWKVFVPLDSSAGEIF